jgi:polyferredoxin
MMSNQIPVHDVTPPSKNANNSVDLYASREKIYTRAFTGLFRNLRMMGGAALFLLYFGTVWLNWGGHQAVWWNLPERKFFIFGATFWPQDFILLSGLLIIAAFGLFFITVYAGRVWCGYTCPQSVWTWIFMWCEKVTEGDRNQRIKLDKAPMSGNKFLRKFAKHTLWLLIGFVTGMTFVGYFSPIRELVFDFFTGQADGWSYFWVGFFTLATYGNAGWLREQVCIYMCPYARFQSVMFDKDTLIVSYDPRRGESRGPRKKGADYKARAWATASTAPCACRSARPASTSATACRSSASAAPPASTPATHHGQDGLPARPDQLHHRTQPVGQKTHKLRPRLIGYAVVLLAMISLLATAFFMRSLVGFDVSKDRVLYRENAEGRIENVYSLKIMNKDQRDHTYVLDAAGLPDLACKANARSRWPPAISSACRWNCRAHRNNCRRAPTR